MPSDAPVCPVCGEKPCRFEHDQRSPDERAAVLQQQACCEHVHLADQKCPLCLCEGRSR